MCSSDVLLQVPLLDPVKRRADDNGREAQNFGIRWLHSLRIWSRNLCFYVRRIRQFRNSGEHRGVKVVVQFPFWGLQRLSCLVQAAFNCEGSKWRQLCKSGIMHFLCEKSQKMLFATVNSVASSKSSSERWSISPEKPG